MVANNFNVVLAYKNLKGSMAVAQENGHHSTMGFFAVLVSYLSPINSGEYIVGRCGVMPESLIN